MDRAIKFYTEILGFKLKNRFGDHWADIAGPGIALGLHPSAKEIIRGENLQIGLKVSDLNKAISELGKRGIRFKKNNDDQVRIASFTDPDNNVLYLIQP